MHKRVLLGCVLVCTFLLTSLAASAQSDVVFVIGWEQEPDRPTLISNSAFSVFLDNFYHRDVWDWKGNDREIYPVMVEEIPSFENGLVSTVPVTGDFNADGVDEEAEAPVVTYKLREGMMWSDGTPITADDCMFYHNLMFQENPVDSVARGVYPQVVEKAEKVDDLTVVLTYKVPYPDYLGVGGIVGGGTLSCAHPAHILNPVVDTDGDGVFDGNIDTAEYFRDWTLAVGYGPYMISEYNAGQNMSFVRNPNWGANDYETAPTIDRVVAQFIRESEQMQNSLEVGDIDMAFNFTTPDGYDTMESVEVFNTPGVFNDSLWINTGEKGHPAIQDVNVRTAIAHAIDRRTLANELIAPGAGDFLPKTWFPQQFWSEDLGFLEYDVDLANQLLDASGWVDSDGDGTRDKDGQKLLLRFFTTSRDPRPDYQTFIQASLAEVGIGTQSFIVDGATVLFALYLDRGVLNTGEYDLAIFGRSNNPLAPGTSSPEAWHCSGIPSAENTGGLNNTFYCNPEFDELDTQIGITINPEERLALQARAEKLFYEGQFWHGLYFRQNWYAARTDRWNIDSMREMGTLSSNYFNQIELWQPVG